jgi:predicted GNAT family acetyltransferase
VVQHGMGLQMMGEGVGGAASGAWEFVPLRQEHVPQMVALAKLTNPGPFAERTIEFGNFVGVFDGERLMGMSGHRLHPVPYIEVSGVCVHPDYSGRGLGGALTLYQVERIRELGEIPILHVWASNTRAIGVYEHLGFVTRAALHFNIIRLR